MCYALDSPPSRYCVGESRLARIVLRGSGLHHPTDKVKGRLPSVEAVSPIMCSTLTVSTKCGIIIAVSGASAGCFRRGVHEFQAHGRFYFTLCGTRWRSNFQWLQRKDSDFRSRLQGPLPCRLATPQYVPVFLRLYGRAFIRLLLRKVAPLFWCQHQPHAAYNPVGLIAGIFAAVILAVLRCAKQRVA